ncbi:MAG: isoprenylcysteine carboxylmethyltransferase family protein [Rhodospirillales bacterium]|nr:isoprenylcysteine carboxylmethyltransferase family protein [Rhodospirillales bacterium]
MRASRLLIPPVWFALAALAMLALDRALPIADVLAPPWNRLAILPATAGLGLALSALACFLRARTPVEPRQVPRALVAEGPYRLTRNPMYLGLSLWLLALAVFLGALSPFAVIPVFVALITRLFICGEERMLEQHFGDDFLAYKARVRRWI